MQTRAAERALRGPVVGRYKGIVVVDGIAVYEVLARDGLVV